MEQHLSTPNSRIKKGVAEVLDISQHRFEFSVDLNIHDIPFRFFVKDEKVIEQLYDLYPISWFSRGQKNSINVYWFDNREFGFTDEQWEDSSDHECSLIFHPDKIYAIQRDFLGIKNKAHVSLVSSYTLGDGFYNFLRWIAPMHFINTQKYLLHSSCVLDPYKKAHFCFGPSGAGKTTISSLVPKNRVLGDDMNVLKVENGRCWAQAGALGQAITNPKEYSQWYPVVGFYWLEKSKEIKIESLKKSEQFLKLSSAVANVFWPYLPPEEVQKIMSGLDLILETIELKKLYFPIDRNLWPTLWSESLIKNREVHNAL